MSSSPAAVYAAEISHPKLRGRLTLLSALCTALGMLFIYLLGYLIPVSLFFRQIEEISREVQQDYQTCPIPLGDDSSIFQVSPSDYHDEVFLLSNAKLSTFSSRLPARIYFVYKTLLFSTIIDFPPESPFISKAPEKFHFR